MENKSNIIEYIKESVLPKLSEAKHEVYLILGRGFEELGDRALYLSHTELARHFNTKSVIVSGKYAGTQSLIAGFDDEDILLFKDKGIVEDVIPEDYKDPATSQFTVGELKILRDKDLWFSFISNSMIKHFITKINEQLNDINKRKKLNEILQNGGKTVDISALKLLMGEEETDGGVYYTSSTIMPRWDIGKHHNGDELIKKFNNEILNHLEIDGFSTNNDDKKVEEVEDDQVQA